MNKFGKYKSSHWSFQSEWRFILKILPITSKDPLNNNPANSNILSDAIFSMLKGDVLPFSDYFVRINDEKFKQMEILLGPRHDRAQTPTACFSKAATASLPR